MWAISFASLLQEDPPDVASRKIEDMQQIKRGSEISHPIRNKPAFSWLVTAGRVCGFRHHVLVSRVFRSTSRMEVVHFVGRSKEKASIKREIVSLCQMLAKGQLKSHRYIGLKSYDADTVFGQSFSTYSPQGHLCQKIWSIWQ